MAQLGTGTLLGAARGGGGAAGGSSSRGIGQRRPPASGRALPRPFLPQVPLVSKGTARPNPRADRRGTVSQQNPSSRPRERGALPVTPPACRRSAAWSHPGETPPRDLGRAQTSSRFLPLPFYLGAAAGEGSDRCPTCCAGSHPKPQRFNTKPRRAAGPRDELGRLGHGNPRGPNRKAAAGPNAAQRGSRPLTQGLALLFLQVQVKLSPFVSPQEHGSCR